MYLSEKHVKQAETGSAKMVAGVVAVESIINSILILCYKNM
jgi:hypothetical protein